MQAAVGRDIHHIMQMLHKSAQYSWQYNFPLSKKKKDGATDFRQVKNHFIWPQETLDVTYSLGYTDQLRPT